MTKVISKKLGQNCYFIRNLPDWISPSLLDKFFFGFDRNLMPNKIWNVLNPWRFLKFWRDGSIRVRICNQISHRISDKIWIFLTYLDSMTEFENFSSFFLNHLHYLYSQKYNSFWLSLKMLPKKLEYLPQKI